MAAKRPIAQSTPEINLPRSFTLPGGYRVRLRSVTFEQLQKIASEGAADVSPNDVVYAFFWDHDGRGDLYLVKGRHPLLLALDFAHEIKHALAEWEDWWLRRYGVEAVVEQAASGRDDE